MSTDRASSSRRHENRTQDGLALGKAVLVSYGADGEHSATVTGRSAASLRIDGAGFTEKIPWADVGERVRLDPNEPPPPPTPTPPTPPTPASEKKARARVVVAKEDANAAAARSSAKGCSIEQIDADSGRVLRVWPSAVAAAKSLGVSRSGLDHCCRGQRKTSHGFSWRLVGSSANLSCAGGHHPNSATRWTFGPTMI